MAEAKRILGPEDGVVGKDGKPKDMVYEKLESGIQRFLRVQNMLENMTLEQVRKAETARKVAPGAEAFALRMMHKVQEIEAGRAEPDSIFQLDKDRLQDIYVWSTQSPVLTPEQGEQVVKWLKRDGHDGLAKLAQRGLDESRKGKA